jgi:hypothetical protein
VSRFACNRSTLAVRLVAVAVHLTLEMSAHISFGITLNSDDDDDDDGPLRRPPRRHQMVETFGGSTYTAATPNFDPGSRTRAPSVADRLDSVAGFAGTREAKRTSLDIDRDLGVNGELPSASAASSSLLPRHRSRSHSTAPGSAREGHESNKAGPLLAGYFCGIGLRQRRRRLRNITATSHLR